MIQVHGPAVATALAVFDILAEIPVSIYLADETVYRDEITEISALSGHDISCILCASNIGISVLYCGEHERFACLEKFLVDEADSEFFFEHDEFWTECHVRSVWRAIFKHYDHVRSLCATIMDSHPYGSPNRSLVRQINLHARPVNVDTVINTLERIDMNKLIPLAQWYLCVTLLDALKWRREMVMFCERYGVPLHILYGSGALLCAWCRGLPIDLVLRCISYIPRPTLDEMLQMILPPKEE